MTIDPKSMQAPPPEVRHADELAFLAAWDDGPRPPRWRLTPKAVVTFVCGSRGEPLSIPQGMSGSNPAGAGVPPARAKETGSNPVGAGVPPARAKETGSNPVGAGVPPARAKQMSGATSNPVGAGVPPARAKQMSGATSNPVGAGVPPARANPIPSSMVIAEKFVGDRALVERCVVTLAGARGLLLVGEPGTAKSMLSELLAAAVCGTSGLTVQGTAGTAEEHLRYGWNYALLLAKGPRREALVPSPVLTAMETGAIARIEEVTRCLPEVQDALVSILSDRRVSIPELGEEGVAHATQGFNVIATANLRDRGVSEMSAALKRRFNFEIVPPIPDLEREVALVQRQATDVVERVGVPLAVDDRVLEALVTAFRDLRAGRSVEGWAVERPSTVMSTAEAVGVATSMGLQTAFLDGDAAESWRLLPGYLLGVVLKDDPKDRGRLLSYWDGAVKRRAEQSELWKQLHALRSVLEE